ncbi:hypothetical protein GCM10011404_04060 [Sphingomonas prati]|nr:hypothetical protein GCM10011404_04060 [Sphingomonas prati]
MSRHHRQRFLHGQRLAGQHFASGLAVWPDDRGGTPTWRRRFFPWGIGAAWLGYATLQYRIAGDRVEECIDFLSGAEHDICIRHAMEQRDNVPLWAIGIPLVLLIIVGALQHARQQP